MSKAIKIPKLNSWFKELAGYNIMFVHIKGKNNVLVDAISRVKTLNIYKKELENPKTQVVSNRQENDMEINAPDKHTISISTFHTEQKCDKTFKKLASQICHSKK